MTGIKRIILALVFALSVCSLAGAADYGEDKKACDIRYFVTAGTTYSRSQANSASSTVRKLYAGDIVYVDEDTMYYEGERAWVKVSGEEEYVDSELLTIEDNPNYELKIDYEAIEARESQFKIGFYGLPKWLVLTMLAVWMISTFLLCLLWVSGQNLDLRWKPLFGDKKSGEKPVLIKRRDATYGYGQKKIFFFSPAPYKFFGSISLSFIGTFLATILLFLIVGSLLWGLAWIGHILVYVLFWAVLIGSIAAGVFFVIRIFFDINRKFLSLVIGVLLIILFSKIVDYTYLPEEWAYAMREWGDDIFSTFNIWGVSVYIVKTYWLTALVISLAPIAVFLLIAICFIAYAGILVLLENIKMRSYNVKNPCPYCGEHSEPAIYYSNQVPLNVPLMPGVWGIYCITHPATGEKMPTLFANGKENYERRCPHCDRMIRANIGIEKHIAVAGPPNSGKTALLYRIISELRNKRIGDKQICQFTDDLGEDSNSIMSFLDTIKAGQSMEYFPEKTSEGRHRAIQMLIPNCAGALPYRLFINDIAGELFTSTNNQYEDAACFKNTDVLIFVVDPFTIRASDLDFSDRFIDWYKSNVGEKADNNGKVDIHEAFNTLVNTLSKYKTQKEMSEMKLMFTFVKSDTGYLDRVSDLKEFAIMDMGLEGIILGLEQKGFELSYYATSASESSETSGIGAYIDGMMSKVGISIDKIDEAKLVEMDKQIREAKAKLSKKATIVKPQKPIINYTKRRLIMSASFVLAGLLVFGIAKYTAALHLKNYTAIQYSIDLASSKELNYDAVMNTIKTGVATMPLSESNIEELGKLYAATDREKRKHISRLRSVLSANFKSSGGGRSKIELALMYGVLNINQIRQYLYEFGTLAPDDEQYIQYQAQFDNLIAKYKQQ